MTAPVARWRAATATLTWVNCGHPPPHTVERDNNLKELEAPEHPALGAGDGERTFEPAESQLLPGERLILITDGVTERHTEDGGKSASAAPPCGSTP